MMTSERDTLSKTVARTVAIIEDAVPALVTARDLMDRFHGMIRSRMSADLEPWITDAMPGLHEAEAGEATDVWTSEAGPPSCTPAQARIIHDKHLHQVRARARFGC
jgi:hypothetical protein